MRTVDKTAYSRDMWPKAQIWVQQGESCKYPPDCVVWPRNADQVSQILKYANQLEIPVIPYGAGSGVCGGTIPIRGGIILDLKALDAMRGVDDRALTVDAESGIMGQHLEMALNHRGYTMGHFPSSIYCSTLGGWLAARSAGQYSSKYGKIEDMVQQLEVYLPSGERLLTDDCPAPVCGVDWNQVLIGSEGCLGVITRAVMKIHPAPLKRAFRGFHFPTLKDGIDGIRSVMQAGLRPCLLRLYDPFDSMVNHPHEGSGFSRDQALSDLVKLLTTSGKTKAESDRVQRGPASHMKKQAMRWILRNPASLNWLASRVSERCLLIVGFEGDATHVDESIGFATGLLTTRGGHDLGAEPGRHWYGSRYAVSYKQSPLYALGAVVDTMEVATTWDKLHDLYWTVKRATGSFAFVMAHFSHAYTDGCSIYFTFAAADTSPEELEERYNRLWRAGLRATADTGATISHHHGVGMAKSRFMTQEYGDGIHLYAALKQVLDPKGIMNPGKLWADLDAKATGIAQAGE